MIAQRKGYTSAFLTLVTFGTVALGLFAAFFHETRDRVRGDEGQPMRSRGKEKGYNTQRFLV